MKTMRTLRYTICTYFPNLSRSDESYDFAVVVASEHDAALMGVSLSAYGLKSSHSLTEQVFADTTGEIENRIDRACQSPEVETGFDLLDAVISKNISSFLYQPIQEIQSNEDAADAIQQIFDDTVRKKLSGLRPPRKRISDRWCESERMDTTKRQFALASTC